LASTKFIPSILVTKELRLRGFQETWDGTMAVLCTDDDLERRLALATEWRITGARGPASLLARLLDAGFDSLCLNASREDDLTPLYAAKHVKRLKLSGRSRMRFDFSRMPWLTELVLHWNARTFFPECMPELEDLAIFRYSNTTKPGRKIPDRLPLLKDLFLEKGVSSLSCLPSHAPVLEQLIINDAKVESLHGIERVPSIRGLYLDGLRKLEDLSTLEQLPRLEALYVNGCRKVISYDVLARCRALQRMRLNNAGRIRSISFLRELPLLREVRFVSTAVDDGDMTPLIGIPEVGFLDKRHHSHKYDEIVRLTAEGVHRNVTPPSTGAPQRPKAVPPQSPRHAEVGASIQAFLDDLHGFEQDVNDGVTDTEVREVLYEAIVGRVIGADPKFPIPDDFRLLDDEGDDDDDANARLGTIVAQLAVDLENCETWRSASQDERVVLFARSDLTNKSGYGYDVYVGDWGNPPRIQ
jgi:protein phosphatase 1 regulatory subunit 7